MPVVLLLWRLTLCVLITGTELEGDLRVWVHVPHLPRPHVSRLPLSFHTSDEDEEESEEEKWMEEQEEDEK